MILYITNAYPSSKSPDRGIFNKEQVDSVKKELKSNHVKVISVDNGFISYLLIFIRILFLNKKKYKIIHFHHGLTYIFFRLLFLRKTVYCSLQNQLKYEFLKSNKFKSNLLVNFFKIISYFKKDSFIFKGEVESIWGNSFSLPNGVDLEFFKKVAKSKSKERQGLDLQKKYLLFASSKNPNRKQKRMDLFMKLFDDDEIKNKYTPLIASNLNRLELRDYINSADMVIVPSDYEGSSNIIKESIACSAQLLITKVGDYYNYKNLKGLSFCEKNSFEDLLSSLKSHNFYNYDGHYELNKLKLSKEEVAKSLINIYGLQTK
jgi:glycosyltransferase involved in cell wall biosynthesis